MVIELSTTVAAAAVVVVQVVAQVARAAEKGQTKEEDQGVTALTRDATQRVLGAIVVRIGIRMDANVLARAVMVFVVAVIVRVVAVSVSSCSSCGVQMLLCIC